MTIILLGLGIISALATIQLFLSLLLIQSGDELQIIRQHRLVRRELEREKKKQKRVELTDYNKNIGREHDGRTD